MPTSGMTVRVPSWRYFPVALALVLPVLGCIGWTWLHALSTERAEAATAGRIVRVQTGQIMARALDILPRVTALSAQSCQTARPDLYRWGTLNPYFRSLLLVKREHIYCSSALGEVDYETGAFHRWPVGAPPTQWFVSVSGTPWRPTARPCCWAWRARTAAAAWWWSTAATCRTCSTRCRRWGPTSSK
ncbi:CSS-motif domain-containing protein [Achromobacter xylosoxidans]